MLQARTDRLSSPGLVGRAMSIATTLLPRSRGCLFTFHRAASSAEWETKPNRNFYIDLDFLDRLLAHLARTGRAVVTLDEALRRAGGGDPDDCYVNFSVDDCYRDTFEQVVPLFRRHGVPVTLFVTTGIPDVTLSLWGAGLEDVLLERERLVFEDGPIDVSTSERKRQTYARIEAAWDGPQAAAHYAAFCLRNGVNGTALHWKHALSWEMLLALRDDPLVEIGAHTVSHARISALPPHEAFAELQGSRNRLEERLGRPVRHFAFPYGRSADASRRDFGFAREAGFKSAATTRKGLVRPGQDVFMLPRNTLRGAHRNLLAAELHLSGLTGAAARMLGRV